MLVQCSPRRIARARLAEHAYPGDDGDVVQNSVIRPDYRTTSIVASMAVGTTHLGHGVGVTGEVMNVSLLGGTPAATGYSHTFQSTQEFQP
jgi:hypothetical protein